MIIRLITLDKYTGVIPVEIGDVVCLLIIKDVLEVSGKEETHTCGMDQLCDGLMEEIEWDIHIMSLV